MKKVTFYLTLFLTLSLIFSGCSLNEFDETESTGNKTNDYDVELAKTTANYVSEMVSDLQIVDEIHREVSKMTLGDEEVLFTGILNPESKNSLKSSEASMFKNEFLNTVYNQNR